MPSRSQRLAEVRRQCSDVKPGRAPDRKVDITTVETAKIQGIDGYFAGLTLNLLTLACQLIQGLTIHLDCRVHRWNLQVRSAELAQCVLKLPVLHQNLSCLDDRTLAVARFGGLAQADSGSIVLVGTQKIPRPTGRRPKAQR